MNTPRGGKRCERCERCSCKDFPTGVKNSGEERYYYRKYLFVTGPGATTWFIRHQGVMNKPSCGTTHFYLFLFYLILFD